MLDRTGVMPLGSVLSEFLAFFDGLFNRTNKIEGSLWKMVIFALQDAFKASDCIFKLTSLPGAPVKTSRHGMAVTEALDFRRVPRSAISSDIHHTRWR